MAATTRQPLPLAKRFARLAVIFTILSLMIFLATKINWRLVMSFGGVFRIRHINVRSEWPLPASEVEQWTGNIKGANLLFLDGSWVVQQLKMNPWVDQTTVRKEFPDQIQINITTKRALALEIGEKGKLSVLDTQGNRISNVKLEYLKMLDLPTIQFESPEGRATWATETVPAIFQFYERTIERRHQISEVVFSQFPFFSIFLIDPKWRVDFNFNNWEEQLPLLEQVIAHPPENLAKIRRLNLEFPKKAVVSLGLSH